MSEIMACSLDTGYYNSHLGNNKGGYMPEMGKYLKNLKEGVEWGNDCATEKTMQQKFDNVVEKIIAATVMLI